MLVVKEDCLFSVHSLQIGQQHRSRVKARLDRVGSHARDNLVADVTFPQLGDPDIRSRSYALSRSGVMTRVEVQDKVVFRQVSDKEALCKQKCIVQYGDTGTLSLFANLLVHRHPAIGALRA